MEKFIAVVVETLSIDGAIESIKEEIKNLQEAFTTHLPVRAFLKAYEEGIIDNAAFNTLSFAMDLDNLKEPRTMNQYAQLLFKVAKLAGSDGQRFMQDLMQERDPKRRMVMISQAAKDAVTAQTELAKQSAQQRTAAPVESKNPFLKRLDSALKKADLT